MMNSRSLRVPRLMFFFLIFALSPFTSGVQACENGTYPRQSHDTKSPGSSAETSTEPSSSTAPDCIPCNSTVPFCYTCRISENSANTDEVNCTECFAGYQLTDNGRNCSRDDHRPSGIDPHVVGLIVGVVVGVVVVVGLVILVVCLVRSGKCSTTTFRSTTPPPLPDPDHLANSYKDNQHSGTGQGRDHRYAKEPGPTSPRVESVQYDGVKVDFGNESSPYVNCTDLPSTAKNAKRKTKAAEDRVKEKEKKKEEEEEEEEEEDGDLYINSPAQQQQQQAPSSSSSSSSRPSKAIPSPKGPGPMKPKPNRKQKDDSKTATEKRESVFPPEDSPEQVYSNEPDSENEEDYVNADVTQLRASR